MDFEELKDTLEGVIAKLTEDRNALVLNPDLADNVVFLEGIESTSRDLAELTDR